MNKENVKMKRNTIARKNQQGWTLIETLVTLMFVGVLAASAYSTYQSMTENQERSEFNSTIIKALGNAKSVKQQWGSYAGFSNTTVFNSKKMISAKYRSENDGQFTTPYSDNGIEFSPANSATMMDGTVLSGNDKYLQTIIKSVPSNLCSDTVDDFIASVLEVRVGGTRISGTEAKDAACSSASNSINITLISM